MVWPTVQFGNIHYIVKCVLDESLEVDVIIGTDLMNYHIITIRCREQRAIYLRDMLPLLGAGT